MKRLESSSEGSGLERYLGSADNWLVTAHKNADPDAVASALLAYVIVRGLGGRACILFPEGVSAASKRLLAGLGIEVEYCTGDPPANVVVVDTANPAQLGGLREVVEGASILIVVDHHRPGDLYSRASYSLVNPSAASTTELLALEARRMGVEIPQSIATLGLAGILYDSKRFLLVGPGTFRAVQALIDYGGDYSRALQLLTQTGGLTLSERIARLKAVSRARLGRACKEVLIAVTHVGSYESSAARALLEVGADVAVVLAERREGYRVSVRVSRGAEALGITADKIALYLAEKYGGEGGGHSGAGMAQLPFIAPSIEEATDMVAKTLPGRVGRICTGGK
ncbi:MAG: DHH family phosphoesterase [Desulfurococcales archaeon]|nr:DHH family phosphoesterase [Desulfurococcales archaeon]